MNRELPKNYLDQEPARTQPASVDVVESLPDLSHELHEYNDAEDLFAQAGFPLCEELQQRLGEVGRHRFDNRKGSGFTSATTFLEGYISQATDPVYLLDAVTNKRVMEVADEAGVIPVEILREQMPIDHLRAALPSLDEGSRLFAGLLLDVIAPEERREGDVVLPPYGQRDSVGRCTTAEAKFLDILSPHVNRRIGTENINIIVDANQQPLMIRKEWGEKTCLTLKEMILNGVRLPPGTLLYAKKKEHPTEERHDALEMIERMERGEALPERGRKKVQSLSAYDGFHYLRLTTLAVSPENRKAVFKDHYDWQKENELPKFDTATIDDFRVLAQRILLDETEDRSMPTSDDWTDI